MKKILYASFLFLYSIAIQAQTYTTVSTFAGSGTPGLIDAGLSTSQFMNPYGVCSDPSGAIYVADCLNNCIRKIQNGIVVTIAGNGTAGDVDAQGLNARFNHPTGVYYKNNYLYICDNLNNKIKKWMQLAMLLR
jgi:NHL repeat